MSEKLVSPVEQVVGVIPMEARLSFAEADIEHTEWRHATKIAGEIGTYDKRVMRIAEDLQLPFEKREFDENGKEIAFYPPYASSVIAEELSWRDSYKSLPSQITKSLIAENVGRSNGWTSNTLDMYGFKPNNAGLYPKRALKFIRHISMAVPLDEGWYNLGQLAQYTKLDREWIERRLNDSDIMSQRRRSAMTGKIFEFFPPEALDVVIKAAEAKAEPGGEWLTVHAIAERIDRNYKWVGRRLAPHAHLAFGKLDDMGVERNHFAPAIVAMLQEESERQKQLPDGTEYLSVHKLARKMGHATPWAEQILYELGEEVKEVKNTVGGTRFGYHISLIDRIKSYDEHRAAPPKVTAKDLIINIFMVGSLRSKIRAQRQIRQSLRDYPLESTVDQLVIVNDALKLLSKELRAENQRLNRAIDKSAVLPGFITGVKNL